VSSPGLRSKELSSVTAGKNQTVYTVYSMAYISSTPIFRYLTLLTLLSGAISCSNAYYAAWEKLGYEKRDLLRSAIAKARHDEVETAEQFKDALEALQAAYGTKPSELQKFYSRLKNEYESSEAQARTLKGRVTTLNKIAGDLFREWKNEADSMSSHSLRTRSLEQREKTMDRFADLSNALERSEKQMDPVLEQMKEYVLFLKHNLNAQSIGSLREESRDIQLGMDRLTDSMSLSINEMDSFLRNFSASDS